VGTIDMTVVNDATVIESIVLTAVSAVETAKTVIGTAAAMTIISGAENIKKTFIAKMKTEIARRLSQQAAGQVFSQWVIDRDTFYISIAENADDFIINLLAKKMVG
jgi:hypothetical protein